MIFKSNKEYFQWKKYVSNTLKKNKYLSIIFGCVMLIPNNILQTELPNLANKQIHLFNFNEGNIIIIFI